MVTTMRNVDKNKRLRHWCVTDWPETEERYREWCDKTKSRHHPLPINWLSSQLETTEGGTPHVQAYVEFTRGLRLSEAKKFFTHRAHLEPRLGTRTQANDYCLSERWCDKHSRSCACELSYSKNSVEGSQFTVGVWRPDKKPKSSRTGKADEVVRLMVEEGRDLWWLAHHKPYLFFRFHAAIASLQRARDHIDKSGMLDILEEE